MGFAVRRALCDEKEPDPAKAVKKNTKSTQAGLSSFDMCKALDKTLRVTRGWGLEKYIPEVRLCPGQPLTADTPLHPEDPRLRPAIIPVPDEHAPGLNLTYFLWHKGLRGFTGRDPCHRDWNDALRAVNKAGLSPALAKTTLIMSSKKAPWLQGDFLRQRSEAFALMAEDMYVNDEFFSQYAELLAFDLDLPSDTEPSVLLEQFLDYRSAFNSGIGVSTTRWFAWTWAYEIELDREWTKEQMVTTWINIQLGRFLDEEHEAGDGDAAEVDTEHHGFYFRKPTLS